MDSYKLKTTTETAVSMVKEAQMQYTERLDIVFCFSKHTHTYTKTQANAVAKNLYKKNVIFR